MTAVSELRDLIVTKVSAAVPDVSVYGLSDAEIDEETLRSVSFRSPGVLIAEAGATDLVDHPTGEVALNLRYAAFCVTDFKRRAPGKEACDLAIATAMALHGKRVGPAYPDGPCVGLLAVHAVQNASSLDVREKGKSIWRLSFTIPVRIGANVWAIGEDVYMPDGVEPTIIVNHE